MIFTSKQWKELVYCRIARMVHCYRFLSTSHTTGGQPYLQVLHSGAFGTEPCIQLYIGWTKYLFNYPQGIYRTLLEIEHENRSSFVQSDLIQSQKSLDVFCTGKTWRHFFGMTDIFFELDGNLKKGRSVTLHGPNGIGNVRDALTPWFDDKDTNIIERPYTEGIIHFPNLTVCPLPLFSDQTSNSESTTVAYFCRVCDLSNFLLVDCPSERFINSLLQMMEKCDKMELVVHMTPECVFRSKLYQSWMTMLGPNTKHLVLNENSPNLPHLQTVYRTQLVHHSLLDPLIFPQLYWHRVKPSALPDLENRRIVYGEPQMKYIFGKNKQFERTAPSMDDAKIIRETKQKVDNYNKRSLLPVALNNKDTTARSTNHTFIRYPEVVILGTSSVVPTLYRNVSGILLNLRNNLSILLDCGPGTLQQLAILYGPEKLDDILRKIRLIFVSHAHADHHLGLVPLIIRRREAFDNNSLAYEKFYLISNELIHSHLNMYSMEMKDLGDFAIGLNLGHQIKEASLDLGLKALYVTNVDHSTSAKAIIVKTNKTIIYSGDTKPCSMLINAGLRQKPDLLIHEATFDPKRTTQAYKTCHSTTRQAIEVGRKMGAKFTILTHFSTRYKDCPIIDKNFGPNVGVAWDFMRFTLDQRKKLSEIVQLQKAIYQTDNLCR